MNGQPAGRGGEVAWDGGAAAYLLGSVPMEKVTQPANPADPRTTSLRLTWLGHSSVVLDLDGVRLLTDPLLRRNAGAATPPADDSQEW